jgi:lipid-binding SYLF domain-containing protein
MKLARTINAVLVGLSLLNVVPLVSQAADDLEQLKQDVANAIDAFKRTDSTLAPYFTNATGYVVFPSVSKGGLVFGGARGQGLVYEKGALIGKAILTQATFGAQIGGQVFREVIFFETPGALGVFKESKLEMSAQVGAVAAAEGVAANAKYRDGVLVFTQPLKGLMGEASLGGQKLRFELLSIPPVAPTAPVVPNAPVAPAAPTVQAPANPLGK